MSNDARMKLIDALKSRGFRASIAEPDVFLQGGMVDYLMLRVSQGDLSTFTPISPEALEDVPTDVLADIFASDFEQQSTRY